MQETCHEQHPKKLFSILTLAPQITNREDFWFLCKILSVYAHKQAHLCDYRKRLVQRKRKEEKEVVHYARAEVRLT